MAMSNHFILAESASSPKPSQHEPKLDVIVATEAPGWNTTVNRVLATYLARNPRLRIRAFVPESTWKGNELIQTLNVELLEDKNFPGNSPEELLGYPSESLQNVDFLVMHSYNNVLAKQAEKISSHMKCKWVHVIHQTWPEFVKFCKEVEGAVVSFVGHEIEHQDEYQKQKEVLMKADLVVAIGPRVASFCRTTLKSCSKDTKVLSIIPGIFPELIGVHQIHKDQRRFNVLIYVNRNEFFKHKGCDITARAISSLQDMSYHLTAVVVSQRRESELKQHLIDEGMDSSQLTVVSFFHAPENWDNFISKADVLIMPSRVEGFGMSGVYAISADLPVLISGDSGLGMFLKKLASGQRHVVDSEDPQVWADKIKEVREKGQQAAALEAKILRKEYMNALSWEDQCSKLVDMMMIKHGKAYRILILLKLRSVLFRQHCRNVGEHKLNLIALKNTETFCLQNP